MRRIFIGLSLLVGSLLILSSCSEEKQTEASPRSVKVQHVASASKVESYSFSGQIHEKNEINLAFKVGGQLEKLLVNEGDYVAKGQLIAEVDSRDYLVRLDAAKAQYMQAKSEYERYQQLYDRKKLPVNTLDKLKAAYLATKSNYDAAQNAVNDTQLKAPFSGYVFQRTVANYDNIALGQTIVTVIDVSSLEVRFNISGNLLRAVQHADSIRCDFSVEGFNNVPAKLLAINQKANTTDQYEVRAQLQARSLHLKPGMTAKIRITDQLDDAHPMTVPVGAVFYDANQPRVWTVDQRNMKVKSTPVKLGSLRENGQIEVLNGISDKEPVVIAGVNSLVENQEVKILNL
jgi:RND family efflux transporter, MFP subunit